MEKTKYNFIKEVTEKAYSTEKDLREKGTPLSVGERTKLSRMFEQAGESFSGIKDERILKAVLSCYKKAEQYAPYPSVRQRIKKNIEKLESPTITPKSLEKKVFEKPEEYSLFDERLSAVMSIITLSISLLFVSVSATGYSIFNLGNNDFRFWGLCFFACGLIFAFVHLRNKK